MSKKVLILSSSPRKGGNSDILCDTFAEGAKEAGNEVEKVLTAAGDYAYMRKDGIVFCPIGALRP